MKPGKKRGSRTASLIGVPKPKFWMRRYSSLLSDTLIIARGRLQVLNHNGYSIVKTRNAYLFVAWAGGGYPPSIYQGNMIQFMARFKSFNHGEQVWIVDAIPFQGNFRHVVDPAMKHLFQFAEDPREWALDAGHLDVLKLEDYNS